MGTEADSNANATATANRKDAGQVKKLKKGDMVKVIRETTVINPKNTKVIPGTAITVTSADETIKLLGKVGKVVDTSNSEHGERKVEIEFSLMVHGFDYRRNDNNNLTVGKHKPHWSLLPEGKQKTYWFWLPESDLERWAEKDDVVQNSSKVVDGEDSMLIIKKCADALYSSLQKDLKNVEADPHALMRYFSTPSDRTKWVVGTQVEVLAPSRNRIIKNRWYPGVIDAISHDQKGDAWLNVTYSGRSKKIKRNDEKMIRLRRSPEQLLTDNTDEAIFRVLEDLMKNMSPSDMKELTSSEVDEHLNDDILDGIDFKIIRDYLKDAEEFLPPDLRERIPGDRHKFGKGLLLVFLFKTKIKKY